MIKRFAFFAFFAVLCAMMPTGCHPAYKATATPAKVQKMLCAEEWLLFPDQPHPVFEEMSSAISDATAGMALPKKYLHYHIAADTLSAFFAQLRTAGKKGGIILPVERHCEPFELKASGAMAAALQEKYPAIISLQGQGVNNKAADVRLDWNGQELRGQITYNGATYFITPVKGNNEVTYIVYNREDSGEVKQPFESTPAKATPKIYYDR